MRTLLIAVLLIGSLCYSQQKAQTVSVNPPATVTAAAIIAPDANTITFDAQSTDGSKFGQIGFLSSVGLATPADDYILPLNPYYWRTGRHYSSTGMPNSFDLYNRLQNLGVQKQILILSDFRNTAPTDVIYNANGAGALADSMSARAQRNGMDFEWDLYNEPNALLRANLANSGNLDSFMNAYWIPAYRAIKARFPNAKIHGPSTTINNSDNGGKTDSALIYKFFDAAIQSNTMPDYVNWHFQIGYNVPDAQNSYVNQMRNYLSAQGVSVDGFVCGETVRPGSERNTSPGVHVAVLVAAEVYKIPQIHAAWTAQPVYGVRTAEQPVIDGLLANTDGTGRRGVWWTYEFYGRMTGTRIKCVNSNTGISTLSGLAFRDDDKKEIKIMVGVRDNDVFGNQTNKSILIGNLYEVPGLVNNEKIHIKAWHNKQTQVAVNGYGETNLEKIIDADFTVDAGNGGSILIDKPTINKYAALLIEITRDSQTLRALPVHFGPINVKRSQKQVFIDWETLSERDCNYFEIEASKDGKQFKTIGKVQAKSEGGFSDTPLRYSFEISDGWVFSLSLFGFLALTGFMHRKHRWFGALSIFILIAIFFACTKKENVDQGRSGDLFIRIKQVDKDNSFKYSKVIKAIEQ